MQEWRTVALFGALALGVSLIDARIAYLGVLAIVAMIVVTNGSAIADKFKGGGSSNGGPRT